ncbi:5751_t:CDS:2, partial [Cetraspora pellucida]
MQPPPSVIYENAYDLFQSAQMFANFHEFIVAQKCIKDKQYIEVRNRTHNYDLSEDLLGHPICHQLTEQQLINIFEMTASGSCPWEIISTICQNNLLSLVINKNIYNAYDHFCKQSLKDCTPVEALINKLREKWPEHQQAATQETLKNMIDAFLIGLQNPQVSHTKERPP